MVLCELTPLFYLLIIIKSFLVTKLSTELEIKLIDQTYILEWNLASLLGHAGETISNEQTLSGMTMK